MCKMCAGLASLIRPQSLLMRFVFHRGKSMERQVEQYIQGLSDLELIDYTRTATHLPEALEFANIELAGRLLPSDHLKDIDEQLRLRKEVRVEEARIVAAEPLNWEWRIAAFLSGLYFAIPFLLFVPAWHKFRDQGADRKYKEMWVSVLIGFCLQRNQHDAEVRLGRPVTVEVHDTEQVGPCNE